MNTGTLFKINLIVQTVLSVASQVIELIQKTKKKKDEKEHDNENENQE